MRVAATTTAIGLTIASAYCLYAESVTTRRLEAQVQMSDRQRERLENEIAVLRAERAYLSRPGRIEPAAHALGMRPPVAGDYIELSEITAVQKSPAK
mgnify:FL=1